MFYDRKSAAQLASVGLVQAHPEGMGAAKFGLVPSSNIQQDTYIPQLLCEPVHSLNAWGEPELTPH